VTTNVSDDIWEMVKALRERSTRKMKEEEYQMKEVELLCINLYA
jgi:hypothetical protein